MRKTVNVQKSEIIHVCDLCEKNIGTSPTTCWVCQREVCYQCYKLLFAAHHTDLVELATRVCVKCLQHELLVEKIQAILDGANNELREWVALWKKAVRS